jgi:hypothetical protein
MSTRADIRALARVYSDQDSSDFPTDAQYNIIIDAAARKVWMDLYRAGWPVNFSTVTFTSTGATTYTPAALASGVTSIHGVYYLINSDRYELRRVNESARAQLLSATAITGYAEYYDVRVDPVAGFVIELLPKSTGITYSVDYISGFTSFASDSTVWGGPIGSDELIALRAAIVGTRKEGEGRASSVSQLKQDYVELLQEVTDMASWTNLRGPAQIRDVTDVKTRFSFDYPVSGFNMGQL